MKRYWGNRIVVALIGCLSVQGLPSIAAAEEAISGAAKASSYVSADGERYFSVSLEPEVEPTRQPAYITVMFDTSASQGGNYRQLALATLESLLKTLQPEDRVRLTAVDLKAIPMTDSFVAVDSDEMRAALDKLNKRVPLGSTDMGNALTDAAAGYAQQPQSRRAVVYIGDGMSSAKLVGSRTFQNIVSDYRQNRIAVSSYAIGPNTNDSMLSVLANHTGGRMVLDAPNLEAEAVGKFLSDAATGTVIWPTETTWSAQVASVYPTQTPPLRLDRDTVVIGTGDVSQATTVAMTGEIDGRVTQLQWTVPAATSSDANGYLVSLTKKAATDDGASLATIGTAGLEYTRRKLAGEARSLIKFGENAIASKNGDVARRFARKALQIDPTSVHAQVVEAASARLPAPDDGDFLDATLEAGDITGRAVQRGRQMEQVLRTDVNDAIKEARQILADNPHAAKNKLRLMYETIREVADISPEVQDELLGLLSDEIKSSGAYARKYDSIVAERAEREAITHYRQQAVKEMQRKEKKDQIVMRQFEALMDDGRFNDESYVQARDVATQLLTENPDVPTFAAADAYAVNRAAHDRVTRILEKKRRGYIDTLHQAEIASVPESFDIMYPDRDKWQQITRDRAQYASVDLSKPGSAEKKILSALDKPVSLGQLNEEESSLADVTAFLSELSGVDITFDDTALDELGIGSDSPVSVQMGNDVSLRSALKIILNKIDPELTFMIKNEVLTITTREVESENLITKVYPVADLVLPFKIANFQGAGGFNSDSQRGGYGGIGNGAGGFNQGIGGGQGGGGLGGQGVNLGGAGF